MKFFRFYFLEIFRPARFKNSQPCRTENCGFNLMELMVAVGILAVISMMIFASYPELSQRMAIKRTSEEIALIARQAQAYSLGIKRPASGGDDYYGFGINFQKSKPKSIFLFTDSGAIPNKIYDAGELFQEFKIDTGDYISELRTYTSSGAPTSVNTLNIVYPRAASMAEINNNKVASYAKVTIKSPRGNLEKNIKIWISGQISVE